MAFSIPDIPIPEVPDLCNTLPVDDIASKLTGALPSQISGLPTDLKDSKVDEVVASLTPDMESLVSNAVDNYKDAQTGRLPEMPDIGNIQSAATNVLNGDIPDLGELKAKASAAIFDSIEEAARGALDMMKSLKDQKLELRIGSFDFLKQQKECVSADITKDAETASSLGNMLGDVTSSVSKLANVDLRNFGADSSILESAKSLISSDVLQKAATALKTGATTAERKETTSAVLLNTQSRVPSKGIGKMAGGPGSAVPGATATGASSTGASPTPLLSAKAYKLILDFEVGGGAGYYNARLSRPSWPGVQSGVTIGVGYDLGYYSKSAFALDWRDRLDPDDFARLERCVGLKKTAEKTL